MRIALLFAAATIAALALETTLAHLIPFDAIVPNFVIVLAVDLGLREHDARGAALAFIIGYMNDAVAGAHLGMNAFTAVAAFLAAYEISRRLITTNAALGAMIVFVASVGSTIAAIAFTAKSAAFADVGSALGPAILKGAISAAFAPYVFALMGRARSLVGIAPISTRE